MDGQQSNKRPFVDTYFQERFESHDAEEETPLLSDSQKSRYRGVFPTGKKFKAQIQVNRVKHHLGLFATELEAARAYDEFARVHYKKTNFPYDADLNKHVDKIDSRQPKNVQLTLDNERANGARAAKHVSPPLNAPSNAEDLSRVGEASRRQSSAATESVGVHAASSFGAWGHDSNHSHAFHAVHSQTPPAEPYCDMHIPLYDRWNYPYAQSNVGSGTSSHLFASYYANPSYQSSPQLSENQQQALQYWEQQMQLHYQHEQQRMQLQQALLSGDATKSSAILSECVRNAHPVVYVPVPMPLAGAVVQYIKDFHAYEQQQYVNRSLEEGQIVLPPLGVHRDPVPTQAQAQDHFHPDWAVSSMPAEQQQHVPLFASQAHETSESRSTSANSSSAREPEPNASPPVPAAAPEGERIPPPTSHSHGGVSSSSSSSSSSQAPAQAPTQASSGLSLRVRTPPAENLDGEIDLRSATFSDDSDSGEDRGAVGLRNEVFDPEQDSDDEGVDNGGEGGEDDEVYLTAELLATARPGQTRLDQHQHGPTSSSSSHQEQLSAHPSAESVPVVHLGSLSSDEIHAHLAQGAALPAGGEDAVPRHHKSSISRSSAVPPEPANPASLYVIALGLPDQLATRFYFHGTFTFDPDRCVQVWKGAWLGSQSGKPPLEAFQSTDTTFEYATTKVRKFAVHQAAQDDTMVPLSGYFKGHFRMDTRGTGVYRKQPDREYVMIFEHTGGSSTISTAASTITASAAQQHYSVHGRGTCDFGSFVVQGRYSSRDHVLEVVREFVTESDPRAAMNLAQLRDWMKQGNAM